MLRQCWHPRSRLDDRRQVMSLSIHLGNTGQRYRLLPIYPKAPAGWWCSCAEATASNSLAAALRNPLNICICWLLFAPGRPLVHYITFFSGLLYRCCLYHQHWYRLLAVCFAWFMLAFLPLKPDISVDLFWRSHFRSMIPRLSSSVFSYTYCMLQPWYLLWVWFSFLTNTTFCYNCQFFAWFTISWVFLLGYYNVFFTNVGMSSRSSAVCMKIVPSLYRLLLVNCYFYLL